MDEIHILGDLVVVFGCAAPVVYLFHRLRQSPIVGFVLSGVLIGPFSLSLIHDVASVNTLAVLGVMILLFSLGLEFSLKKLMETRVAVFITGPLQMAGTAIPVILLARLLGLSTGTGLIYGILIAVSSTTVLMKMLAERSEVDSLRALVAAEIKSIRDLRFGIFREDRATVPRIRLSSDVDVYTETWDVPQGSPWSGTTVADSRLRSDTGVLILGIIRENRTLNNPGPDEQIFSGDRLVLSGTKEQLGKVIQRLTGPGTGHAQ